MSQLGDPQTGIDGAGSAAVISTNLVVGAVIFFIVMVAFVFFLYLYAKYYWGSNPTLGRSRARFVFAADDGPLRRRGLDAAVLRALPVTVFRSADFKEGLECAVCLTELSDGEAARLLPKCSHGFHLECIDMWFHSHSTCPLCRSPVEPAPPAAGSVEIPPPEVVSGDGHASVLPANVLFWGSQDRVSAGAATGLQEGPSSSSGKPEGMLVIDIPRRAVEGFPSPISPLRSSRFLADEMKTPPSARLRSLTRLLSRGKRTVGSSCSPRGGDIEQGLVGGGGAYSPLTPKAPKSS